MRHAADSRRPEGRRRCVRSELEKPLLGEAQNFRSNSRPKRNDRVKHDNADASPCALGTTLNVIYHNAYYRPSDELQLTLREFTKCLYLLYPRHNLRRTIPTTHYA
jgi:hypothetical protein